MDHVKAPEQDIRSESVYGLPLVHSGGQLFMIAQVSIVPAQLNVSAEPEASVTIIVKPYAPVLDGVPHSVTLPGFQLTPCGRVPRRFQVNGALPSDAVSVSQ